MDTSEVAAMVTPEAMAQSLRRKQDELVQHNPNHGPHHGEATETVRHDTYQGHDIVIRTSYRIEVDGMAIEGHLAVGNDGQVHYHAIPNLSFSSAVDLAKRLIDAFPEDFADLSRDQPYPEGS